MTNIIDGAKKNWHGFKVWFKAHRWLSYGVSGVVIGLYVEHIGTWHRDLITTTASIVPIGPVWTDRLVTLWGAAPHLPWYGA